MQVEVEARKLVNFVLGFTSARVWGVFDCGVKIGSGVRLEKPWNHESNRVQPNLMNQVPRLHGGEPLVTAPIKNRSWK